MEFECKFEVYVKLYRKLCIQVVWKSRWSKGIYWRKKVENKVEIEEQNLHPTQGSCVPLMAHALDAWGLRLAQQPCINASFCAFPHFRKLFLCCVNTSWLDAMQTWAVFIWLKIPSYLWWNIIFLNPKSTIFRNKIWFS